MGCDPPCGDGAGRTLSTRDDEEKPPIFSLIMLFFSFLSFFPPQVIEQSMFLFSSSSFALIRYFLNLCPADRGDTHSQDDNSRPGLGHHLPPPAWKKKGWAVGWTRGGGVNSVAYFRQNPFSPSLSSRNCPTSHCASFFKRGAFLLSPSSSDIRSLYAAQPVGLRTQHCEEEKLPLSILTPQVFFLCRT